MARLRWTVFVEFWGNRDPPELSRLLRGKANKPTKFWGNRDPPELSRLLRGKANRPTKFWGHRDPLELGRFLFGSALHFYLTRGSILEGPCGQNCYSNPTISATPEFGGRGATRPSDPTLPSRAHPQDYGS